MNRANVSAATPAPMPTAHSAQTPASTQVRRLRSASTPTGIAPIEAHAAMISGISPTTWSDSRNVCSIPCTAWASAD